MGEELEPVSMDEIEAEDATSLPNKEVMSLLDVNANVNLGLDLAAPVDLAAAANLNVAAPIEAAASANLLSDNAQAVALASQHGTIDQAISGSAEATAPQNAEITQGAGVAEGGTEGQTDATADADAAAPVAGAAGAVPAAGEVVGGTTETAGGVVEGAAGAVPAAGGAVEGAAGAVPTEAVGGAVGETTEGVTGGVGSLLNGGSLLDANIDIDANAAATAPINGAVAANGNIAAPIDAAVAANVGSDGAVAQALADQQVDIHQSLDDVSAEATAEQNATIEQP